MFLSSQQELNSWFAWCSLGCFSVSKTGFREKLRNMYVKTLKYRENLSVSHEILRERLFSCWQHWCNLSTLLTAFVLCFGQVTLKRFQSWGFLGICKTTLLVPSWKKGWENCLNATHHLATDFDIKLLLYVDLHVHIFQETFIILPVVYEVSAGLFLLFKISFKVHGVE